MSLAFPPILPRAQFVDGPGEVALIFAPIGIDASVLKGLFTRHWWLRQMFPMGFHPVGCLISAQGQVWVKRLD